MNSRNIRIQTYSEFEEYVEVAELILADNPESHIKALSLLKSWCKRKAENKISRSIFLTCNILDAYYTKKCPYSLAMVISKFINSECREEDDRNKFNYKLPIYSTAKNINLPAYMINLRHDIVHSDDLVENKLLDEAFTDSIEWLKNKFWIPQLDIIKSASFSPQEIHLILDECLVSLKTTKKIDETLLDPIFNGVSFNHFFTEILSDKYLFKPLSQKSENIKKEIKFWNPLLEYLDNREEIDSLIERVFDCFFLSSIESRKIIRLWCLFLLKSCSLKRELDEESQRLMISSVNVSNIDWRSIFMKFIRSGLYRDNFDLLEQLVSVYHPPMSNEKQEKILTICRDEPNDGAGSVLQEFSFSPMGA